MFISFFAGLLGFGLIFIVPIMIFRLVQRKYPGRPLIWFLFIGTLFFADMMFARFFFLDLSTERTIDKAQPLITAINQYRIDSKTFPSNLNELVPLYIDSIPKPSSSGRIAFRYKNYDSTFTLSFNQWVGGRTYRSYVYSPIDAIDPPEYASEIIDSEQESWKYYYY